MANASFGSMILEERRVGKKMMQLSELPGIDDSGAVEFEVSEKIAPPSEEPALPFPPLPVNTEIDTGEFRVVGEGPFETADALLQNELTPEQLVQFPASLSADLLSVEAELAALEAELAQVESVQHSSATTAMQSVAARPAPDYISEAALSGLSERVAALERLIGKPAIDAVGTKRESEASLVTTVMRIRERLDCFDVRYVDSVKQRLLLTEEAMRRLIKQAKEFPDAAERKTVPAVKELAEEFSEGRRLEALAEQVPPLACRLLTLRDLHSDAIRVRDEMRAGASAAAEADDVLQNVSATVATLKQRIAEDARRCEAGRTHVADRVRRIEAALSRLA